MYDAHVSKDGAGADLEVVERVLLEGAEGDLVGADALAHDLRREPDLGTAQAVEHLVPARRRSGGHVKSV